MSILDLAIKSAMPAPRPGEPLRQSLGGEIVQYGSAVIFNALYTRKEIHWILDKIVDPEGKRSRCGNRLIIVPMRSAGGVQPLAVKGADGQPTESQFYIDIRQQLLKMTNVKMVVFDPINSFVSAGT